MPDSWSAPHTCAHAVTDSAGARRYRRRYRSPGVRPDHRWGHGRSDQPMPARPTRPAQPAQPAQPAEETAGASSHSPGAPRSLADRPVTRGQCQALPTTTTATGIFRAEPPVEGLACACGASAQKLPRSQVASASAVHGWRAVSTTQLGAPQHPYPGDHINEVRSRDLCSDSVVAWMNYLSEHEFGDTWSSEAVSKAGDRGACCWEVVDS